MSEKTGTVLSLDDMDVMAFAKSNFRDAKVDRMKKHEISEDKVLYRMGNAQDDDVLHLMIETGGAYTAYGPNEQGAMKSIGTGQFKA